MVMFGFQEYVRKAARQLQDYANDVVVACGMFFPPKVEREILQSAVNTDAHPFSGPLAYGVMSRTLKIVEVPYYISQRAAGFRFSTVTFLLDKLGIDPLGEVTLDGGMKTVLYIAHGDCCATAIGYRVASMLHYMPCFEVAVFASGVLVQWDARCLENEVDHDIDNLCTNEPPNFGHKHHLLQQCMMLTSSSVVAPPTTEQKAEEKRRINEMKEQAKKRKAPNTEDPEWEPEVQSRVSTRTMDERAKDRAPKEAADAAETMPWQGQLCKPPLTPKS